MWDEFLNDCLPDFLPSWKGSNQKWKQYFILTISDHCASTLLWQTNLAFVDGFFLYSSLPGFYGLIGHKDFMSKRYASERSHTLCVNFFLRALPYTLLCSYGSWSIYYFSIHKQFLPEALRSLAHIRLYLLAGLWSPVEVLLDTDRQKIKVNKTEKTFSL